MKFIFPQNYRFKDKLFGIIDYSSLFFNIICGLIILGLVQLLFHSINVKVFVFIILYFPIFLFSVIGFNHENIVYIFMYIIKYIKRNKLYLYSKNNK